MTHEPATSTLDYDALRDSLAAAGAVVSLAELHGAMSGALCAGGAPAAMHWLAGYLQDQELEVTRELGASLADVVELTWRTLEARQLEFEPLLPSDDTALEEQVQALALWCHGFVAGLGANAPELTVRVSAAGADDTVAEVMRDFAEISRAGLSENESAGEDQPDFALAELREYLRAGVQIVFEDLTERRAAARDLH